MKTSVIAAEDSPVTVQVVPTVIGSLIIEPRVQTMLSSLDGLSVLLSLIATVLVDELEAKPDSPKTTE